MRLIDADKINPMRCPHSIKEMREWTNQQPTVKAIPIEWIKKEMKRLDEDIKWAWYYGNVALDKMEYLKMWLTLKLEEWEKENDREERK